MNLQQVVAIDGPSGSGKSTITKLIADQMGLTHIDTGAMYRGIALYFHELETNLENNEDVQKALNSLKLEYSDNPDQVITINGVNKSQDIRKHEVSELASKTSQIPIVREYLVNFQRNLCKNRICIMEGRDIGTVVFPNAFLKVFLNADSMLRARRRYDELKERGTLTQSLEQIHEDVKKRDTKDMQREIAPLKKADDAIELNTSQMTIEEVVNSVKQLISASAKEKGIEL